jgi:hypothetical protein
VKSCPGEEYEVSEDSEGASENLFMLADRVCITPAQELKLLEKVEEIKFKPPFYVAIMSRSTVCQHGPMLVSSRETFSFAFYQFLDCISVL